MAKPWARVAAACVIAAGLILLAAAAFLSAADWERLLRGEAAGRLAWGPALFRILLAAHGAVLAVLGAWMWRKGLAGRRLRRPEALSPGALWPLLLLTLVGAILRLARLESQLWLDEVLTLVEIVRRPLGEIVSSFPSQNQHMLYSILAKFALESFGESAWALRLPAAIFGVLSLWPLYALGLRLSGRLPALLACALMTFSYHHIWFSQNARGYTGLLLFATLATWLWIEAEDRDRWSWWLAYAVAVFLGVWVQMTMLFVVAGHGLVWLGNLLRRRKALGAVDARPVVAWLLAGSMSLQVYAFSLPEFLRSAAGEVSMPSAWTDPLWLVAEVVRNLAIIPGGVAAVAAGVAVLGLGWWSLFRRHGSAAMAMVLPVALCAVTMIVLAHNLWPRFFFFAMGFALLLVVEGALRLGELAGRLFRGRALLTRNLGLGVAGLLVAAFIVTSGKARALPKQDYLGAKTYIEARLAPGDAVVTVGLAAKVYQDYYAPHWAVASTPEELDDLRRNHRRLWLVYTLPVQLQGFEPGLWAAIQRDFVVVSVFPGSLGGGEVYVCRERPAAVE
jgi:4-amino-4-deoxy-L-arabinose transferase-like glycosyltransferase